MEIISLLAKFSATTDVTELGRLLAYDVGIDGPRYGFGYIGGLYVNQVPSEEAQLCMLLRGMPYYKTYLELGCNRGGRAIINALSLPRCADVQLVDESLKDYYKYTTMFSVVSMAEIAATNIGRSVGFIRLPANRGVFIRETKQKFDVICFDDAYTPEELSRDFEQALLRLSAGGMLIVNGIQHEKSGIPAVWKDIAESLKKEEIIELLSPTIKTGGIGLVKFKV